MKLIGLFIGILLVSMLWACAPRPAFVAPEVTQPEAGDQAVKVEKEDRWEKTIAAARKESSVVIIGGSGVRGLRDATSMLKNKFGINLELTSASGGTLVTKLLQERRVGLYTTDITLTGHDPIFQAKAAGALDPLEPVLMLPEILDPKLWWQGKLPWADANKYIFNIAYYPQVALVVNTDMVQSQEVNSYQDLLNPKWKGKIIMADPTITGSGGPSFDALIYYKILDLEFFRKLVLQDPLVTRDENLLLDWVAKGKYPIALWPSTGRLVTYLEAGSPLRVVELKEGAFLSAGGSAACLMNKAPHPNAATVFLNWLFSREGSIFMQNAVQKQSSRIDIPTEGLDPVNLRKPGVNYVSKPNEIEEWVLNDQEKSREIARTIFAPITK